MIGRTSCRDVRERRFLEAVRSGRLPSPPQGTAAMPATKLLATFAALAALGAAATPALAADPDQITVKVKVGDLNLDTEGGARLALSRIQNASHFICGEEPSARAFQQSMLYRA